MLGLIGVASVETSTNCATLTGPYVMVFEAYAANHSMMKIHHSWQDMCWQRRMMSTKP